MAAEPGFAPGTHVLTGREDTISTLSSEIGCWDRIRTHSKGFRDPRATITLPSKTACTDFVKSTDGSRS